MLSDAQRAALATRLRRGREDSLEQIPRRPAGLADLPLSFAQKQLGCIDRFAPDQPTYNIPLALRLTGPLDAGALNHALDLLIERHETLRTRLVTSPSGAPVQLIDPARPAVIETVDLGATQPDQRASLGEFLHAESLRPFALAEGPLLRASLARFTKHEHLLLIVDHPTIFDGWSSGVLLRDLAALYQEQVSGTPASLPEPPIQYADYAVWER